MVLRWASVPVSAAGVPTEAVVALIAFVGVLLASLIGFVQWRRGQRFQQELEDQRRLAAQELEAERRRSEREKTLLEDRLARDRELWNEIRGEERREELERAQLTKELQARAESAGDLGRAAGTYRELLINEISQVKILDMSRPMSLESLYVQVRVREDRPTPYPAVEQMLQLQASPEDLLRLSAKQRSDADAVAMEPEEALTKTPRFVVLGDPGAGKTTMLRHLALRMAQGAVDPHLTLPVYVELRKFIDSGLDDLIQYAGRACERRYGFQSAAAYIEEQLAEGHAALLLDGLDEVLGGDDVAAADRAYRRVIDEVDRAATRFPNARIVLTCRRAGWRHGLPAFRTMEVLDFGWPQVERFVDNWFAGQEKRARGLKTALQDNLRIQALAANPLLLSLISIVYSRDLELPERRAELYRRCVEVLLKEWDAHRDIVRFSQFTTDRKRDLLMEIAWRFHCRGLRYYRKDDLLEVIEEFLPTIGIQPEHAEGILGEIAAQYGLLKFQADGICGFMHLTMQEYFAALAANERGPAEIRRLAQFRHQPWWEEVLLLLAGRSTDASQLLLAILGRESDEPPADGEPLAVDDDVLHQDLIFAGRCLAGAPRIRIRWLRTAILDELFRLAVHVRDDGPSAAISALAGAGSEGRKKLIEYLLTYPGHHLSGDIAVELVRRSNEIEHRLIVDYTNKFTFDVARVEQVVSAYMIIDERAAIEDFYSSLWERFVSLDGKELVTWTTTMSDILVLGSQGDRRDQLRRKIQKMVSETEIQMSLDMLIRAFGHHGDQHDAEWLASLFEELPDFYVDTTIIAISNIGKPGLIPSLFESMVNRKSLGWLKYRSGVVKSLGGSMNPAFAERIAEIAHDLSRPREIRWFAIEVLEGWEVPAPSLMRSYPPGDRWPAWCSALINSGLDDQTRVSLVRELLVSEIAWLSEEGGDASEIFNLLVRRLLKLGDNEWLRSEFSDRILFYIENGVAESMNNGIRIVGELGSSLALLDLPDIQIRAFRWLLARDPNLYPFRYLDGVAIHMAPNQALREVAASMERRRDLKFILQRLAFGAKDPELIRPLLEIRQRSEADGNPGIAESAWNAAVRISRNSGARIFSDGRIVLPDAVTSP
jgi:hypothetical protein